MDEYDQANTDKEMLNKLTVDKESINDYQTGKDWEYAIELKLKRHDSMLISALVIGSAGAIGAVFALRTLTKLVKGLQGNVDQVSANTQAQYTGPPPDKEPGSFTGTSGASGPAPGTNTGNGSKSPTIPAAQGQVAEPIDLEDMPIIPVDIPQEPLL